MTAQIAPERKAAIQLINMAVSDTAGGKMEFHSKGTSGDYAGSTIGAAFQQDTALDAPINVATTTLDDYLPGQLPNLAEAGHHHGGAHGRHVATQEGASDVRELYIVKIDTQGFDGVVIEGMKELLRHKQARTRLLLFWHCPRSLGNEGTLLERL